MLNKTIIKEYAIVEFEVAQEEVEDFVLSLDNAMFVLENEDKESNKETISNLEKLKFMFETIENNFTK